MEKKHYALGMLGGFVGTLLYGFASSCTVQVGPKSISFGTTRNCQLRAQKVEKVELEFGPDQYQCDGEIYNQLKQVADYDSSTDIASLCHLADRNKNGIISAKEAETLLEERVK